MNTVELVEVSRVRLDPRPTLAVRRVREGAVPLLVIHGFPCSSVIWARVMQPLASAGFDVVAVDLRGYGESDDPDDGFFDLSAFASDLEALRRELAWGPMTIAGHDLGAAVFDYAHRQGHEAEELCRELATRAQRRAYIASFYTHRVWCPPGAFTGDDLDLLTAPYADAGRLRNAFRDYEILAGNHPSSGPDLTDRPVGQPVMVVFGSDDVTLVPDALPRARAAYPNLVGPFLVPDAGHYVQWEQPETISTALALFCGHALATQFA